MQDQQQLICAAIDIGSNTIHLVVARCLPDRLDILADEVELVRIGESVTATGEISPQKRDESIATLRKYQALAQQHSAHSILVMATEAIRQARNNADFLRAVHAATGLEIQLIGGDVEATLTFYGATYELTQAPGTPALVGVMDLGGGSTELVVAKNMQIAWHTSVPIGSGWVHDRYFHANPPTHDDVNVARRFLQTYFNGMRIKRRPPILIVTGGSANTLLFMARQAFGLDTQQAHLTSDDLLRCEGVLSALSAEEIAERYHLSAGRARILLSGTLIISTVMQRWQLHEIHISPHGIREGALLAYARHGEQWLQQVAHHARLQDQGKLETRRIVDAPADKREETFAHSGRRILLERLHKLLEWREEVLKQEDIEAVHKMRVASRRLRAVLDAYQSVCEPRAFKKAYRQVKDLADILGKARDTDVIIENLRAQCQQMPSDQQVGTQWLIDRLRAYRQQHQQELEAFLKTFDDTALERQLDACLPTGGFRNGKS